MEPVIYEVNIKAIAKINEESFLSWLREHITEMEAIEGFLPKTELLAVEDDGFHISVRYFVENQKAMDRYFNEFSEKMRGDLDPKIKKNLEFSRRVLKSLSQSIS